QPAHVAVLRRRDVEQPIVAPAEIVRRLRIFAGLRLRLQPRIGIERMLLPLPRLLIGELLALGLDGVLRLEMRAIGPHRLARRSSASRAERLQPVRRASCLDARDKALEIALLLDGEFRAHCRSLAHAASACGSANARPNTRPSRRSATGRPVRMRSRYQSASPVSPTSTAPVSLSPSRTSLR